MVGFLRTCSNDILPGSTTCLTAAMDLQGFDSMNKCIKYWLGIT